MDRKATHRCIYCGALWEKCNDQACVPVLGKDHWHLRSERCGSCCDNEPMGHQIVPLSPRDRFCDAMTYLGDRPQSCCEDLGHAGSHRRGILVWTDDSPIPSEARK